MDKYYRVYLAYTKYEVLSDKKYKDSNIPLYHPEIAKICIYKNPNLQLETFANTICSTPQLFEANTAEEVLNIVTEYRSFCLSKLFL